MFAKILIANRGEIACRVIRTARAMGIATAAVYSDADRNALHATLADEAVRIGSAPAARSYLSIDAVIAAARAVGADAVHPGYGFLSENPGFAAALADAGITFIGPGARAMEIMADKIAAKRFAAEAGVSTVPGHHGVVESADEAARIAGEIGYPVMIKAAAGGGGKGMRVAASAAEAREGFSAAASEARSSFGDARVFVEKLVAEPRHIEIQVLADGHGNIVHLGERECSIQRRNQKVIEEAPSPAVDGRLRRAMGAQAIALARAVGYVSAGTVEFIADAAGRFYFLEMNTRLQVEHTVTEMITGLDLVEQMIRIAAGERLAISQKDVRFNGWAIEARVYAEDPARNFLPSTGRLVRYRPPAEGSAGGLTIRNDTGVEEGSTITVHYDPLIAKLCCHGPSRGMAAEHLLRALDCFTICGVEHNVAFLAALLGHPRWREARLTTHFIDEEFGGGFAGAAATPETLKVLIALAAVTDHLSRRRAKLNGARALPEPRRGERVVAARGEAHVVSVVPSQAGLTVTVAGEPVQIATEWRPGDLTIVAVVDGEPLSAQFRPRPGAMLITHRGASLDARVMSRREADLAARMPQKTPPDMSRYLVCPMPGTVISLAVEEGQPVKSGEALCIVEAMKMENILRAERDGRVARILASPGDSLAVDAIIMEFE